MMKQSVIAMAALTLLLVGCDKKAGTGAIVGGALGAGTGGLISHTWGGAAIGAGIGAVAGGLVGWALDDQDRKIMEKKSPTALKKIDNGERLSVTDVKSLSNAGLRDEVIITQIQGTQSTFNLSNSQIADLKRSGVSQSVIDAMLQTG